METLLIVGIVSALAFNFLNGLHDAANSISTIVATRVLSPLQAVCLAAVFNLIGPLFLTTAIAVTIGKGIIAPGFLTLDVLIIGIIMASAWILFTACVGIPVSSTHAMIGGLLGTAVAFAGLQAVILPEMDTLVKILLYGGIGAVLGSVVFGFFARKFQEKNVWDYVPVGIVTGIVLSIPAAIALHLLTISGILKIVLFIAISPCLGFIIAFLLGVVVIRLFRNADSKKMNWIFSKTQIISAAFYSLGHGSNDAQHAMGIITAMLVVSGILSDYQVPVWVILVSSAAISLGTLTGGWKIVQTMAKRITQLKPYQGFCAETGGGIVLLFVSLFGIPVSSTHAISGCIMGIGSTKGNSAVQWNVVRQIVAAWIITIPLTAGIGFLAGTIILTCSTQIL